MRVGRGPSRHYDDASTKQAYRFMRRFARGDPMANARLERAYPDLYRAHSIWDNPSHLTKWIIEAGILADRTHEEIGEYVAVPPNVVAVYECIFFDVRWARKEHEGWLISKVFYPSVKSGFLRGDPDQTWKAIACWGGWEALRSYMTHMTMPPHVIDYFRTAVAAAKLKAQFVAANVTEINAFNAVDYLTLGIQDLRLEKEFGGQAANAIESSIGGLMDSIEVELTKQQAQLPCEEARLQEVPPAGIFLEAQKAQARIALRRKKEKSDDKGT